MKSTLTTRTNDHKELHDFGCTDRFGRKIGAEISTYEADFTSLPEGANCWYNQAPGHYYGLRCWATRYGATYGAIQPNTFYRTEAERTAAITKYLAGAQKRATKIH